MFENVIRVAFLWPKFSWRTSKDFVRHGLGAPVSKHTTPAIDKGNRITHVEPQPPMVINLFLYTLKMAIIWWNLAFIMTCYYHGIIIMKSVLSTRSTHWGLSSIAAILQMAFPYAFCWMEILLKFHWIWSWEFNWLYIIISAGDGFLFLWHQAIAWTNEDQVVIINM